MEAWMGGWGLGLVVAALAAGGPPTQEADREAVLQAARELMESIPFCTMVTLAADGTAEARAMEPFPPADDLTVWMGTDRSTRKVEQLQRDPRVTLLYLDAEGPGYVTLVGRARLVEDPVERRRRWNPEWAPFYESGPDGPDYLLIEFTPDRVELISNRHGIANDPRAWKPAIVELR